MGVTQKAVGRVTDTIHINSSDRIAVERFPCLYK